MNDRLGRSLKHQEKIVLRIRAAVKKAECSVAKKKKINKYVDDLGRKWDTDMGDVEPGDTVWLGFTSAKVVEFDPKMGSVSALYEWTAHDGAVKRHLGLPPLKVGHAYRAEQEGQ